MRKRTVIIRVLVVLGTIAVINLASYHAFFRLDFTADKSFTLSEATRSLLRNLDSSVIIKAYFSEDLPTQLIKSRKDFRDILTEYKYYSKGKLSFEFINPNKNDEEEKKAQEEGVRPVMVNVSERDQVKQLRAYMGATIVVGGQKEAIPTIRPGESAEFPLTIAIKKLTSNEKQKIAFLQGHGEYPNSACQQLVEQLSVSHQIENYTIDDTSAIPSDIKTVVMFNPRDSIPPAHFQKIENYLDSGGNLLIGYSGIYGSINTNMVERLPENGMREWLAKNGVLISAQIVTDMQCRTVGIPEQAGSYSYTRPVKFPYFPIIKTFETHPVTKGIEAVFFPFVSSINLLPVDSTTKINALAYSSNRTGLIKSPLLIDVNKQWTAIDFTKKRQIVAVALERRNGTGSVSKMLVVANGNFAVNTEPGHSELSADNINFASNGIDWLSDDTGLIELRTKSVTYRPLDDIEDSTKALIKYFNVFLPILLIIIIGLSRKYRNQRKRRKLMQVVY
jgi:gliding-associated putative ABC transporter substrate-binding component GldG